MIKQFYFKKFNLASHFKWETILFDLEIGPYQILPLWATVDLGVMPKLSHHWSLSIRLFNIISRIIVLPF